MYDMLANRQVYEAAGRTHGSLSLLSVVTRTSLQMPGHLEYAFFVQRTDPSVPVFSAWP